MATKQAERRKARIGATLASASSLEKDMRASLKTGADIGGAKMVGKLVAERAVAGAGVKDVVFDRGGYLYHGHVRRWPTLRAKAN